MSRDELIAALEKATGGDRELDARIEALRMPGATAMFIMIRTGPSFREQGKQWVVQSGNFHHHPPHYTSSRDAMITGAEKLLWYLSNQTFPHKWLASCVNENHRPLSHGIGMTEPLARRIAEIKALVKP